VRWRCEKFLKNWNPVGTNWQKEKTEEPQFEKTEVDPPRWKQFQKTTSTAMVQGALVSVVNWGIVWGVPELAGCSHLPYRGWMSIWLKAKGESIRQEVQCNKADSKEALYSENKAFPKLFLFPPPFSPRILHFILPVTVTNYLEAILSLPFLYLTDNHHIL
jgi:hypothetical protein